MPSLAVPADGPDTALDRRTQEAILRAAAAAQSPGTRRAYDSAWARFERWCATHQHRPLPARPDVVAAYLVEAAETVDSDGRRSYAAATLAKWVAAISDRHRRASCDSDPTQHALVRATAAGLRREYAIAGDRPRTPRDPLLTEDIMALVETARAQVTGWASGVRERRDTALLLMGFAGAFRRSELVALTGADLALHPLDGVHIHVRRSKTDQGGEGRVHALPRTEDPRRCPPCAYTRWALAVAAFDRGGRAALIAAVCGVDDDFEDHLCRRIRPAITGGRAVFRSIAQNGNLSTDALSGAAVHSAVRRRAERAGFSEDEVARLGAHSLRAGFVTQAIRNGADTVAIMRQTAHQTPAMVARYAREKAPLVGNAVTELGL